MLKTAFGGAIEKGGLNKALRLKMKALINPKDQRTKKQNKSTHEQFKHQEHTS